MVVEVVRVKLILSTLFVAVLCIRASFFLGDSAITVDAVIGMHTTVPAFAYALRQRAILESM